jgi:hypothetical protein
VCEKWLLRRISIHRRERDKGVNRRNYVIRSFRKSAIFAKYYSRHKIKKDEIDGANEIR